MRITRVSVERTCSICERTLLMGERAVRFSPNGGEHYVDVCPLCQDTAIENGWIKEGSPTTPTIPAERRRTRFSLVRPARPRRRARRRSAGGDRADPAPPLRARARDRRGGRPLQRVAVPAHGRRDREEPRRAARLDRAALGRQPRRRRHGRLGDLLVPVPRHAGLRPARAARRARARSGRARGLVRRVERPPRATTAVSSRTLRVSDLGLR